MNVSEKLTAAKASLKTKSARLEELLNTADGAVPSDAEQAERATLTKDVTALNADIEALSALEAAQANQAKPAVLPKAAPVATATPHVVEVKSVLPPGIEFARFVACKMASHLLQVPALEVAKQRYPDYPRIQALLKTAVTGHTTADGAQTGGQELNYATNLTSEFVEFLRPQTIIGKFGTNGIPSLRRVPFNVRITGQTSGGAAGWVGQGVQKPLTKFDFSSVTLTWAKVAAITVLSQELARFSSPSAEGMIRDALADCLIARLDTDFVDPTKAVSANVSPASITNAMTPLTPSGTDAAAVRADIKQILDAFIAATINPANGVFITTESTALVLSLMRNALGQKEFPDISMRGGTLEGFPVITSQYAGVASPLSNHLIFVNASDVFLSDDGGVSIDMSREASLEMETDPANQSGSVVSMFQTDQIAIRAERYINWALRRAAAVAWIDSVAYASGSPS